MSFKNKVLIASLLLVIGLFWSIYGIWGISVNGGLFHTNDYEYYYNSPNPVSSLIVQNLTSEVSVSPNLIQLPTYSMKKNGLWVMDNEVIMRQPLTNASKYGLVLSYKQTELNSCIVVAFAFILTFDLTISIYILYKDKRKLDHTLPAKE